jgi:tetratricopeptide (TPR) repeat protein
VNVSGLVAEAVALHKAGRVAEATTGYQRVLEQIPNHFDATHLLGVIALQEGRLDEAEELITRALRFNAKDWSALNNLGMVHLRKRNLELAQAQFERAIKANFKSVEVLTNLGTVLRESGRPRDALVPLNKAHAIEPNSSTVCNLLGACLLDLGDVPGAVKLFDAATRAHPDDADGWGNLAVALNRSGEHARAQECADKAVELRPDSAVALAARAAVEFESGLVEAAIVTYEEAIELGHPSVQTVTALANALWCSGRCDEAMEHLRRATLIDGQNLMTRWKLAISHCRPYYAAAEEIPPSREAFARALDDLQAWFRATPRPEAYLAVASTQPFFLAYQPFNNRDLLSRYGDLCSEWMATMPLKLERGRRSRAQAAHRHRVGAYPRSLGVERDHQGLGAAPGPQPVRDLSVQARPRQRCRDRVGEARGGAFRGVLEHRAGLGGSDRQCPPGCADLPRHWHGCLDRAARGVAARAGAGGELGSCGEHRSADHRSVSFRRAVGAGRRPGQLP